MKARLFALGFIGIVSLSATTVFAGNHSAQIQQQFITEEHLTPEQLRQAKVAEIKGLRPTQADANTAGGDRPQIQGRRSTEEHLTPEQLRQAKVAEIKGFRSARAQMEQVAETTASTTNQ